MTDPLLRDVDEALLPEPTDTYGPLPWAGWRSKAPGNPDLLANGGYPWSGWRSKAAASGTGPYSWAGWRSREASSGLVGGGR